MITPYLEKLILEGKAAYKTFVVGGSGKNVLNVKKDRFIIITDLLYFSSINTKNITSDVTLADLLTFLTKANTQLRIFSKKSNNKFIFRNNFTLLEKGNNNYHISPIGSVSLNTFLVHDSSVSFTFSVASNRLIAQPAAINKSEIGYPPPYDYGIEGQTGALANNNVTKSALGAGTFQSVNGGEEYILKRAFTSEQSLELSYPVDAFHLLNGFDNCLTYPLLNISYIEIIGNPVNMQSSQ
jgi:hypothetical protein